MTFFFVRMKIWSNKGHAEKNKVKKSWIFEFEIKFSGLHGGMADRLPSKTNEEVSDTLKGGLELKTLFHFFYLSKIPIARVR